MTFIQNLESLCNKKHVTVSRMLSDIGLSKGMISNCKSRGTIPSGDSLIKIADYFGVTVDYLLGRDTTETSPNTSTVAPQLIIQYGEILKYISSLPSNEQLEAKKYFLEYIQLSTECRQEVNSFIEFVKSKDNK